MTSPVWIFRVASSLEAGGGHVARCRVLAQALAHTVPVRFVLDRGGRQWGPALLKLGFEVAFEGDEVAREGAVCIVDGYEFEEADLSIWRRHVAMLVVFADFGRPSRFADMSIDLGGNLCSSEAKSSSILNGLQYALVDASFDRGVVTLQRPCFENVVVCFGTRDSKNGTVLALNALDVTIPPNIDTRITVAIGSQAPHLASVLQLAEKMRVTTRVSIDEQDMPNLLASADFVLGAGGVGLLERMLSGIPSITVCMAENQKRVIDIAGRNEATINAGSFEQLSTETLAKLVSQIYRDPDRRAVMARNGRTLVDGTGPQRLAAALIAAHRQLVDLKCAGSSVNNN